MSTAAAGAHRAAGGEAIRQRALHQLHGDGRHAVDLGGAEDEHAVLVIDRRGQPALALEALAFALVAEALLEHLQRDPAPALDLLGLVDHAHAAAPEHAADAVAAEGGVRRAAERPAAAADPLAPGDAVVVRSAAAALFEEAAGLRRLVIAQQLRDVVGQPRIAGPQGLERRRPFRGVAAEHPIQLARRRVPPFCVPCRSSSGLLLG